MLRPSHGRDLGEAKLRRAYSSILDLLDEYEVPATFAFAGAFSQSPEGFARIRPEIEALSQLAPGYLAPALRDIDRTTGDGWHGHRLVDAVAEARTAHEIALHGVTHVPWTQMDAAFAEAEMRLFEALEGPVRASRTFVYPRNLVAHEDVLGRHGFAGFRLARPGRSRLSSLVSEFNLFEEPESPLRSDALVHIPAGFFLNWRSGPRRLVPPWLTRARARRLLDRATATGGVVHYWLHPENVATAPSTLDLLRMLLSDVAAARDAGSCQVLTQLGYCRWIESLP
jgi:peptidoglycan/xylan/chitin deacetylase (PgdA/CDA1 family)